MKSILLAAAAFIAAPAIAQTTTPAPADSGTSMPQDQTTTTDSTTTTTTQSDPSMSTPPTASDPNMPMQGTTPSAPTDQSQTMPAPTTGGDGTMATPPGSTPAGGYQPSQPAMSGQMAPGATVRYQAAQDPNTAYPPPAPKASYPICKKGQYDGCTQASDARGTRKAPRRRR
jgi:hypothetical protein